MTNEGSPQTGDILQSPPKRVSREMHQVLDGIRPHRPIQPLSTSDLVVACRVVFLQHPAPLHVTALDCLVRIIQQTAIGHRGNLHEIRLDESPK
jgi:hypothetical protein